MKTTKKQFKSAAKTILCLLATRQVSKDYSLELYCLISIDYATNFVDANYCDYQSHIAHLRTLPVFVDFPVEG